MEDDAPGGVHVSVLWGLERSMKSIVAATPEAMYYLSRKRNTPNCPLSPTSSTRRLAAWLLPTVTAWTPGLLHGVSSSARLLSLTRVSCVRCLHDPGMIR